MTLQTGSEGVALPQASDNGATSSGLLACTVEAHGGAGAWSQVSSIETSLSSWGLAFTSHMRPKDLLALQVAVFPHSRRVKFLGYGGLHRTGLWSPGRVELRGEGGALLAGRDNPRTQFAQLTKTVHWDLLDLLYFAGYAVWNYICFPFVLLEPGVTVTEEPNADGGGWLTAAFPEDFPTHSRRQRFQISADGRLLRHDYTADVIGRWATAANFCLESAVSGPFRFYTRRKVVPKLGRYVLPGPVLVWIKIGSVAVR